MQEVQKSIEAFFWAGKFIWQNPVRRRLLWMPAMINALLLILFVFAGSFGGKALLVSFLGSSGAWGAISVLAGVLVGMGIFLVGVLLFSTTTLIIGSPWYGALAGDVLHEAGFFTEKVSPLREVSRGVIYAVQLFLVFLMGHVALLLLNILPGIGQVLYAAGVVMLGAALLALEFFGEAFLLQGERFPKRIRLLLSHPVSVAAFALPLILLLLIPGVHIFVPPLAVVAASRLYTGWKGESRML
jgi:CysZ protein